MKILILTKKFKQKKFIKKKLKRKKQSYNIIQYNNNYNEKIWEKLKLKLNSQPTQY